ncbi:DMT family transporter [Flavobacteriaceae bacterium 3-367]|uniref:DMT family transporter n=1 Tax=Eudoraea algarum TaxID=3417568 RepID=UPI003293F368
MPNVRFKNYLHLHFIVFIWGFTAVLGKLISIEALPLVWYRMLLASCFIFLFISLKKYGLRLSRKTLFTLVFAGIIIALHWLTFFRAIKVSNVSVALATMSTGALFTAVLEPIWYRRKLLWYELVFGVMVLTGLYIIFKVETTYVEGILLALTSAMLAAIFSLINGKLILKERPSVISFYELLSGCIFLTVYLGFQGSFDANFFLLSMNDLLYLFILASVCTAYAFIASVRIMEHISPYTVMLTINLEPIYGIVLAFLIFGDSEKMNPLFYVGALIILATVIANGLLKRRGKLKKRGTA